MLTTLKSLATHLLACSSLMAMMACGSLDEGQSSSQTKVTNGLPTGNEFPSVVLLQFNLASAQYICTGTFVNDAQLVTAAHCVYDIVKAGRSASTLSFQKTMPDGQVQRMAAQRLEFHPGYSVVPGQLSPHDLAVVTFPRYTAPAVTALYDVEPQPGEAFTIVGFGVNDYRFDTAGHQMGSGSGVKRKGENQIYQIESGMISFYGVPTASDLRIAPGQNVASGSGDSGGPLLIHGMLAGVTSGGGLAAIEKAGGESETVKFSYYIDLNEKLNREFLKAALSGSVQ